MSAHFYTYTAFSIYCILDIRAGFDEYKYHILNKNDASIEGSRNARKMRLDPDGLRFEKRLRDMRGNMEPVDV